MLFQVKFPEVSLEAAKLDLQLLCYQSSFLLPVSSFIHFAIKTFQSALFLAQTHVRDLFHSGDLSDEGFITLFTFDMICRHLAPASYDPKTVQKLFETSSDLTVKGDSEDQIVMSFGRFSVFSVEYDLFSIAVQNRFIRCSDEGELRSVVSNLRLRREAVYGDLAWRLEDVADTTVKTLLKDFVARLCWALGTDPKDRSLLLAYSLAERETRRVKEL